MKIALFHNQLRSSADENRAVDIEERALRDAGAEVFRADLHEDEFLAPLRWKGLRTLWSAPGNGRVVAFVQEFLRRHDCEVGHVHGWFPLFGPAVHEAHRGLGIPVVQTLHDYRMGCGSGNLLREGEICRNCVEHDRGQAVVHECYRGSRVLSWFWRRVVDRAWREGTFAHHVSLFLAPAQAVAEEHVRFGVDPAKIRVLAHAHLDPLDGAPATRPPEQGGALFAGALSKEEGVDVLLRAWDGLEVPLYVIGSGPERARVEAAAHLSPFIRWRPYAGREELREALQAAAFCVSPHRWLAPTRSSIVEASGCGRAVVASDLGAARDLLEDDQTGSLVPAGDAGALRVAVQRLAREPRTAERFGRAARVRFEQCFLPDVHARALLATYAELVSQRRAAA